VVAQPRAKCAGLLGLEDETKRGICQEALEKEPVVLGAVGVRGAAARIGERVFV
jgi:hypothetical protein